MRLKIENVSKRYSNGVQALDQFELELETGVLGLLGPNGAGKTTLMSILSTITLPTGGRDRIVILSTHIVSDVEVTADRIALVANGRLITCQTPDDLLRSLEGRVWECVIPAEMLTQFKQHHACGHDFSRASTPGGGTWP